MQEQERHLEELDRELGVGVENLRTRAAYSDLLPGLDLEQGERSRVRRMLLRCAVLLGSFRTWPMQ